MLFLKYTFADISSECKVKLFSSSASQVAFNSESVMLENCLIPDRTVKSLHFYSTAFIQHCLHSISNLFILWKAVQFLVADQKMPTIQPEFNMDANDVLQKNIKLDVILGTTE